MPFINSKRLRDYPRLIFVTTWIIEAFNVIFRHGWLGGLGQIIGSDFITLYGAGLVYRTDLGQLYGFSNQATVQQALIQPTPLPGLNPYISPPYVAAFYSLFSAISLPWALIIWTILTILFTMVAVHNLIQLLPEELKAKLGYWRLIIIVFSFFPFIEGFQVGQNHALTLLLATLIVTFTLSERWYLAGTMAGLMIYKPQMVLGLIILWIVWKKYKAITAFVMTALIWTGSIMILNGIDPYISYLNASRDFFLLPYIEGFPGYLLVTIYGLLTSLFPINSLSMINIMSSFISVIIIIGFVWMTYKSKDLPILERTPVIALAFLLPIIATPYALLHDLVILIPVFVLWARYDNSRKLLFSVIVIYLGSLFLPLIAAVTKIAWVACLMLGLLCAIFLYTFTKQKAKFWKSNL
jgi:alpha-1,2-mannosyltransferase